MYTLLTQQFTVSLLVWSFCKLIDDVIYLRENTYCSVLLICILIKLSNLLIMYNNKVEQTSIWAFVSINSNQVLIMVNEHLRMDNNIQMERVAITQRTRRRFSDGWHPLLGEHCQLCARLLQTKYQPTSTTHGILLIFSVCQYYIK